MSRSTFLGRHAALSSIATALTLLALSQPSVADTQLGLADFKRAAFAEAYQEWHAAADAGDPRGALYIGVLYDTGEGVSPNAAEALRWYQRAAEYGSPAGAFNVAVLYDAGHGIARDPVKAIAWYKRAANGGYARAEYNLGLIYESGDGTPRDHRRATYFFRLAAHQGISAARTHISSLELPAGGSVRAAEDPAVHDFALAQQILLTRGPAEAGHAVELFRRAAERNNALAEYDLAYCYQNGLGVERDLARAEMLYERASDHSSDQELRSLAVRAQQAIGSQSAPNSDLVNRGLKQ